MAERSTDERKDALLKSARAERQPDARAQRGLDALLEGTVEPIGVEGPAVVQPTSRAPWLIGVLLLLALAFAWWAKLTRVEPPNSPPPPIVATPPALVPVVVLPAAVDAGAVEDTPLDAGAADDTVDAGVAVRPRPALPASADDDALARELALLDDARVQVTHEPKTALATLDRHRTAFPRGALKLEADVLRVEALLRLGRRADAMRLATSLEKADREGLVQDRLKRLMEQHPAP